jgi:hypothetical protein
MKLSKSTTILINVFLVLLIAILAKSIVAAPQNAAAAVIKEYSLENIAQGESLPQALNKMAHQGWSLAFAFKHPQYDSYSVIFER